MSLSLPFPLVLAVVYVDTKVSDPSLLGSSFSQNGKGSISILNLLLHNAGFPPDPDPLYCEFNFLY